MSERAPDLTQLRRFLVEEFDFSCPDCPGLHFRGAIADPAKMPGAEGANAARISAAGANLSAEGAKQRCLGEVAERLSLLRYGKEATEQVALADIHAGLRKSLSVGSGDTVPCLPGHHLGSHEPVWIPTELCLWPAAGKPPAIAIGTAAGDSVRQATERALLELVERDAAALWWLGGRRPAPITLDLVAAAKASDVLNELRRGAQRRSTWLLDLSTEFGPTVIAAISEATDGGGFACGLGAAFQPTVAAKQAMLEMAQMELSQHLIHGKARALGPEGLTAADHEQIQRSMRITSGTCALILPEGPFRTASTLGDAMPAFARTVQVLCASIDVYAVNLTRSELGIPVIGVLSPQLASIGASVTPERLALMRRKFGGGEQFHSGTRLF